MNASTPKLPAENPLTDAVLEREYASCRRGLRRCPRGQRGSVRSQAAAAPHRRAAGRGAPTRWHSLRQVTDTRGHHLVSQFYQRGLARRRRTLASPRRGARATIVAAPRCPPRWRSRRGVRRPVGRLVRRTLEGSNAGSWPPLLVAAPAPERVAAVLAIQPALRCIESACGLRHRRPGRRREAEGRTEIFRPTGWRGRELALRRRRRVRVGLLRVLCGRRVRCVRGGGARQGRLLAAR